MANKKLLERAKELGLELIEGEPDEDLAARINEVQNTPDPVDERKSEKVKELSRDELIAEGKCPDCKGLGIRNPGDHYVCPTCEGTGKV